MLQTYGKAKSTRKLRCAMCKVVLKSTRAGERKRKRKAGSYEAWAYLQYSILPLIRSSLCISTYSHHFPQPFVTKLHTRGKHSAKFSYLLSQPSDPEASRRADWRRNREWQSKDSSLSSGILGRSLINVASCRWEAGRKPFGFRLALPGASVLYGL